MGNTISVIFAGVFFPVCIILDAAERATGFRDEMQALMSGFKSAMGSGGLRGVNFEINGVIVVAALMDTGLEDTEPKEEDIIDGGGSTKVGGLLSSSILF